MLELIFACTVFALLVSGIILAINRSYAFMNNTKVQIRATNLTREGVEMMFNIRDTNRRKCSGQRDQFWLYLGSGAGDAQERACGTTRNGIDYIFQPGIYTIKEGKKSSNGDKFIYAEKLNINGSSIADFYSDSFFEDNATFNNARNKSKVTFTGNYKYRSGSAESGAMAIGEIGELLGNGVEFYRIVRIYGIYDKNKSHNPGPNDEISSIDELKNANPKEMRFCVKTFYKLGVGIHSSELCSIMTNFME